MLLRSASTPLMKSWGDHHAHLSELSISMTSPIKSALSQDQKNRALCRALSETDLRELSSINLKSTPTHTFLEGIESEESETSSLYEVPTCPCFDGGEGGGGGSEQGGVSSNSKKDDDDMDVYYQNAINGNPDCGLILGNYARFLKEVKGDVERAAEYCDRAIVATSDDGYVLAMYGELIWEMHRDGFRAKTYFDRAVKSAPENCYVLASYARFMWDAEDEEDVDDDEEEGNNGVKESGDLVNGMEKAKLMKSFAVLPPLAASS